jgi:hypothetical protein
MKSFIAGISILFLGFTFGMVYGSTSTEKQDDKMVQAFVAHARGFQESSQRYSEQLTRCEDSYRNCALYLIQCEAPKE